MSVTGRLRSCGRGQSRGGRNSSCGMSECLTIGWEGLPAVFPAYLRILEAYRSCSDGRLQMIAFSVE